MKNGKRLAALETKAADVVTVGEVLELAGLLLVCVAMCAVCTGKDARRLRGDSVQRAED